MSPGRDGSPPRDENGRSPWRGTHHGTTKQDRRGAGGRGRLRARRLRLAQSAGRAFTPETESARPSDPAARTRDENDLIRHTAHAALPDVSS